MKKKIYRSILASNILYGNTKEKTYVEFMSDTLHPKKLKKHNKNKKVRIFKMIDRKQLYILVGDSGSGKNYTLDILKEKEYVKIVTSTTRLPREDEVDGVDYYFINNSDLNRINFIESECFSDSIYGTTQREVETKIQNNDKLVMILEPNGLLNFLSYTEKTEIFKDVDITIIYLDVPKEVRFSRLVKYYIREEYKKSYDVGSSVDNISLDVILPRLLEKRDNPTESGIMYAMTDYDDMTIRYDHIVKAMDRINRASKDDKGKTIFDNMFDPSHIEHLRFKKYIHSSHCRWFRYNPLKGVGIEDFIDNLL